MNSMITSAGCSENEKEETDYNDFLPMKQYEIIIVQFVDSFLGCCLLASI